ncbi:hypothetical protein H8356DRAFT_1658012, partial [Neocallimastix lanati (nom. inval.)]
TSALLVMKMFLLNLSKSNSRDDDCYCISKIYRKPHNIRNSRSCELFRSCSLKCPRSPICNSSKAEILLRRNI